MINYLGYKFLLFCKVSTNLREASLPGSLRRNPTAGPAAATSGGGNREAQGTSSSGAGQRARTHGEEQRRGGTLACRRAGSCLEPPGEGLASLCPAASSPAAVSPWLLRTLPGQLLPPPSQLVLGAAGPAAHRTSTFSSVKWG